MNFLEILLSIIGLAIAALIALAILITPFGVFSYIAEKDSCDKYGLAVDYETKFVDNAPWYWSCQVKTPSGWIDYGKIQNINLGTEEES